MTRLSILDAEADLGFPAGDADAFAELDLRVVETTTPLVTMLCSTSDGCGNTCSGSACATGSNDPI
jgi:FxLD family lantipeptide